MYGLLTAKDLYVLLSKGADDSYAKISFLSHINRYTLSKFWGSFISECVTDTIVNQYFMTLEKRSRALSNIMNRTCTHSMPLKLFRALENSLDEDNFVCVVVWMAATLEQSVNPLALHAILTQYEEKVLLTDPWFEQVGLLFTKIRPVTTKNDSHDLKKLFLLAAFRITMLGLHALYGDRMLESMALKKLRLSNLCDLDVLWKRAISISPRINGPDFSYVHANERYMDSSPAQTNTAADIAPIIAALERSMPPSEMLSTVDPATGGWYVASNWLDLFISVNDIPAPTYDGANQLGEITNGTVMFVLSAPGYKGLHLSKGVWGKVIWKGQVAWIPMNLMTKIQCS